MESFRTTFLRFILFYYFSIFAFFTAMFGYDFFHASNTGGSPGVGFLMFAGLTIFLGFHLLKAFTEPLPAWYTYFSMPLPQLNADKAKNVKRSLTRAYAFMYVLTMIWFTVLFIGTKIGYSLERIVLPIAFGVLAIFVSLSLIQMFAAFLGFWKGSRTLKSSQKP